MCIMRFLYRMFDWIVRALALQLLIFSLSFPVLTRWGLGFSPLVFMGNILFTPFLMIFLMTSCVIFLLELFFIPADYLCLVLEQIGKIWLNIMALAPDLPLIACPLAPVWLLIVMPLGSWAILKTYGFKNVYHLLLALSFWIAFIFMGIKWYFTPFYKEIEVVCGSKKVTCILKEKKVVLIDKESALSSRSCTQAWMDFTLSPVLAYNFGATTIDILVIEKMTPRMRAQVQILSKKYYCKSFIYQEGSALQI